MYQINFTAYGGPDVLRLDEVDDLGPVDGLVRIRVRAAAVNPADLRIRQGLMASRTPDLRFPFQLGFDLAGTLIDDAPGFVQGQPVVATLPWFARGGEGSNAQIVAVDPSWLAPLPESADWALAGSFPLNALTADQALGLAAVEQGQTLLVTGVSGAVGGFAAQIAALRGLRVIGVVNPGDEQYLDHFGVEAIVRDDSAEVLRQVTATAPLGVDAVLDFAGIGAAMLAGIHDDGVFIAPAAPMAPPTERGIRVDAVLHRPDGARLTNLAAAVMAGEVSCRVSEFISMDKAATSHERAGARGTTGKVVLDFS
ncbi:NADP-dependent oxidoreductase [Nocardioides cavernaquae]|nr:NADP-dependent oxidoreductase [Nocardioides cavernaquae]